MTIAPRTTHKRAGLGLRHEAGVVRIDRRQNASHGALGSDVAHKLAGINPLQTDNVILIQVVAQGLFVPPVARIRAVFFYDKTGAV